ncbi:ABC transporter ATP-binding protein [Aquipuribacter sp. SD81]|uniref:ABC transporter ATP-binding protein n=1 Tax=Aquipuribacter sp. SD81 TaxID=3127703 RepID=UPI0030198380
MDALGARVSGARVEVDGLTVAYRASARARRRGEPDLLVLDDVTLTAEPGEVLAVLGPSGCGKSTLLRALAGLLTTDDEDAVVRGEVRLDGEVVRGPSARRGMVAQRADLFGWLGVRDNVAWGPRAAGRADALEVADRLLAETGLDGFADALPAQLSGGMRQRAALAQVLANSPPVLLLDEPFAALDAQNRLRLQEWLRELLRRHGPTVVLVTHDVDEALLLGDRLALLTSRPSTVAEVLSVDLGDMRGRSTMTDRAFVALKQRVLQQVMDA